MVRCPQAFPELLTGSDTDACTLEIYDNANEDDTIDLSDFTERIIDLADASFNGEKWKIL